MMPTNSENPKQLTFDLLDDAMFLGLSEGTDAISDAQVSEIGPLIELGAYLDSLPNGLDPDSPIVNAFSTAKTGKLQLGVHSFFKSIEVVNVPVSVEAIEENEWQSFLLRSQQAAHAAQGDTSLAKAIASTIAEMSENIIWHSDKIESGIVGYQYSKGRFDYVVSDTGIGILASLSKSDQFLSIPDSTEALKLALKNGVSRFSNSRRGTGFNSLVLNLSKRGCDIRFRSGDVSLTFEGIRSFRESAPPDPVIRTCPWIPGFTISFTYLVGQS
ncbi:MAG: hypothetical protein ABL999_12285 [Pyrinomonadaceae bacterium]